MKHMMFKPTLPSRCCRSPYLDSRVWRRAVAGSTAGQAKVSQEQSTKTALARVPNGRVQSAELEREHGKLVWSCDLAQGRNSDVTEIQVDALTGKVVSRKKESAAQDASEASKEAQEQ